MEDTWLELFIKFIQCEPKDPMVLIYLQRTVEFTSHEAIVNLFATNFPNTPLPPQLGLFFPEYSKVNQLPDDLMPLQFPFLTDQRAGFSKPFDLCAFCYREMYDKDMLFGREMVQPMRLPYLYCSDLFETWENLAHAVNCDSCKETIFVRVKREMMGNEALLFITKDNQNICYECFSDPVNEKLRPLVVDVNEDEKMDHLCDLCHTIPASAWKTKCVQLFPACKTWKEEVVFNCLGSWLNLFHVLVNSLRGMEDGLELENCRVSLLITDFATINKQVKYTLLNADKYGWRLKCQLKLHPDTFLEHFDIEYGDNFGPSVVELKCKYCGIPVFIVKSREDLVSFFASIARGVQLPMATVDSTGVIFRKVMEASNRNRFAINDGRNWPAFLKQ